MQDKEPLGRGIAGTGRLWPRAIAVMTTVGLAGGLLLSGGGIASAGDNAKTKKVALKKSCPVYANYRRGHGPVKDGHEHWVTKSAYPKVDWRYNPSAKYSLVKLPEKGKHSQWWFIKRSCLVNPPKKVDWDPVHPSGPKHKKYVCSKYGFVYVRDDQHRVIGRLYNGQTFFKYGKSIHGGDGWDAVGHANGYVKTNGRVLEPKGGDILRPTSQCKYPKGAHAPMTAQAAQSAASASPTSQGPGSGANPADQPSPERACYPQYVVTAQANARQQPAGTAIGTVPPGAKVNLRDRQGAWGYGYITSVGGTVGGFGWLLLEKLKPVGTVCR